MDKRTIMKNVISEYFGIKFYMFKAMGAPLQEQENDILIKHILLLNTEHTWT